VHYHSLHYKVSEVLVIEVFVAALEKKYEINVEIRIVFCYKSMKEVSVNHCRAKD